MKCPYRIGFLAGLALLLSAAVSPGQGSFENLDFESAHIIPIADGPYGPFSIATSNALPGWSAYFGASQQTVMFYNGHTVATTSVALFADTRQELAGHCSVFLQGGISSFPPAASIAQTGVVPAAAQSILFFAKQMSSSAAVLLVSLGAQNLSLVEMSSTQSYTVYGADISAFAGQTTVLTLTAPAITDDSNQWLIDNIEFSNQAIPEPGVVGISMVGVLLVGRRGPGRGVVRRGCSTVRDHSLGLRG
jgi:hypothetical protein